MKLVPKIADAEVSPGSIKIYADTASLSQVELAVSQASKLVAIKDATAVVTVVEESKKLHRWLSQIEESRKFTKRQFLDANKDIDGLAARVSGPIRQQYDRLTALLAGWYDAEERRKAEEERQRRAAEEAAAAEERRKAEEIERQRQALLESQRNAKTLQELEQANLDLAFHDTEIPVALPAEIAFEDIQVPEPPRAPIAGAVTTRRYKFTLTDPVAAFQYSKALVRWELSILDAQDIVRRLNDSKLELKIPGVTIEVYTDVSTPSAR